MDGDGEGAGCQGPCQPCRGLGSHWDSGEPAQDFEQRIYVLK